MTQAEPELVFVYKARSGLLNKLKDAIHKTFSPSTYPCKLCDITYSPVAMRRQWKRFVDQLPISVRFTYTDLIEASHPDARLDYPCACLHTDGELQLLISAEQMNACETIDELIELVNQALAQQGDPASSG